MNRISGTFQKLFAYQRDINLAFQLLRVGERTINIANITFIEKTNSSNGEVAKIHFVGTEKPLDLSGDEAECFLLWCQNSVSEINLPVKTSHSSRVY